VIPAALAFDADGNLYVADKHQNVVWKVAGGKATRVAGSGGQGYNGDGMPANQAKVSPVGLAFDAGGNLYIAEDTRVRMVAKGDGIITTVAGNGTWRKQYVEVPGPGGTVTSRYQKADDGDGGPATQARINAAGIAFDRSGNLYICGGILRKVVGIGKATARP
jgi:hypothetical protein